VLRYSKPIEVYQIEAKSQDYRILYRGCTMSQMGEFNPEYRETREIIQSLRPQAESGSDPINARIDALEDRLSYLTNQIGQSDTRPENPDRELNDTLWQDLRKARREGNHQEEEIIWKEIRNIPNS
jgi:hypothetical protein